jgi:nucleotide-binding universal stress UspA family protein
MPGRMGTQIIVSYDGTPNDDDALVLGKMLAAASGATLGLAYVRHSHEFDPRREELAKHDAERRLEQGASWLGDPTLERHVVVSASTGEGLAELAEREGASLIVFGSDYRTPPGHAEPGTSAQGLLEGGRVAIAVAAAGVRLKHDGRIEAIAVVGPEAAASATAEAIAGKVGAKLARSDDGPVDLIVVGSHEGGPDGRITLSGAARSVLNSAHGSVLVVPRGRPLAL